MNEEEKKRLSDLEVKAKEDLDNSRKSCYSLPQERSTLAKSTLDSEKLSFRYKEKIRELRKKHHDILRKSIAGGINYSFEEEVTVKGWTFQTSLGQGSNETEVEVRYSGLPKRSLFRKFLDLFFNPYLEVSIQATLRSKTGEEHIAPLKIKLRDYLPFTPDHTSQIARYLHQVNRHTTTKLASAKDFKAEDLDLYGWFEDNLVCKTARLLGNYNLVYQYLEYSRQIDLEEVVKNEADKFIKELDEEKSAFIRDLKKVREDVEKLEESVNGRISNPDSEVLKYIEEKKEEINRIFERALSRLENYEVQSQKILEKEVLKEVKERKSSLEKEVEGLRKEHKELKDILAKNYERVDESVSYFSREFKSVFPNYDPYGETHDINEIVRSAYARQLVDGLLKITTTLKKEDVIKIVTVISSNVKRNYGRKKFTAPEMKSILDETLWIASKIGHDEVNSIVRKIEELGSERIKPDIKKIHEYLLHNIK